MACLSAQEDVLAPGNPPLTKTMVEHRIWVLEHFLDIHLSPQENDEFVRATADAWKGGDRQIIRSTLEDLKLFGSEAKIRQLILTGQQEFVDRMRDQPDEALNRILLEAFDAAHPDRKDVMRARGLGNLVGKWENGDAMAAQRNPVTGQVFGISFTDAQVLNIFSDGRFEHLWAHTHCDGAACCNQYGTSAKGTVDVQRSKLILAAQSGAIFSKSGCVSGMNKTQATPPKSESFDYSLKMDPARHTPMLCLSGRPFQLNAKQESVHFCYLKQH
jgi:hypothetical protein